MRLGILWRQSRGVYSWDDPSLYLQDLDFLVGTILSCNHLAMELLPAAKGCMQGLQKRHLVPITLL